MTKKEKREKKKNDRGIVDFIMIYKHFFKDMPDWINEMEDSGNPSYTIYTQAGFVNMGILKNVCSLESMRQMEETFNEENCVATLRLMSGDTRLKEMPHYDTLNYYLEQLLPQCLSDLRRKMVTSLIRRKQFYRSRLVKKYWRVILDGTGLFCFRERRCESCLSVVRSDADGKK